MPINVVTTTSIQFDFIDSRMLSDRFTESMEVTIASKTQIVIAIETKHFQHWVATHVIQNELGATTPKEVVPTQSEFLEMS